MQSCNVILCEKNNQFKELIEYSKKMDFEIYDNFTIEYQIMYYRFEIYNKYLKNEEEKYEKILLCDIDDVIFQEDPFSIKFNDELYFALEKNIISDQTKWSSQLNLQWIDECTNIKHNYDNYQDKHIVCAGTILGSNEGIQKYLDFYINAQRSKIVNDQGLLNVYVYNFLSSKTTLHYKKSKILTLDDLHFESLNIVNNAIINDNGEKYRIIHQINRCNLPFMLALAETN